MASWNRWNHQNIRNQVAWFAKCDTECVRFVVYELDLRQYSLWHLNNHCRTNVVPLSAVLGKGPFRLISFRDRTTLLAASGPGGSVFLQRGNLSSTATDILSRFMMTPGLSRARPHGEFVLFTLRGSVLFTGQGSFLYKNWLQDYLLLIIS